MFLNRLRQSYAFNFLVIYSIVVTLIYLGIYLYHIVIENTQDVLNVVIMGSIFLIIPMILINFLGILISILFWFLEIIFSLKITNENFLNNKYIKICQTLGIIFAFLLTAIHNLSPFLYTITMFSNRLRQSYAFNILCVCGILKLILFIVLLIIGLLTKSSLFGLILFFHIIGMLSIIVFLLSILIYSFELIFSIDITNRKFLSNKKIQILQNFGIVSFMSILIFYLIF